MNDLFAFPNPVNETAARTVAAVVAVVAAVTLVTGWHWLLIPLAYGFVARVLTGPTLSPLGRLAQDVIARGSARGARRAGPPKRFAQGIGAVCTVTAAVFALVLGWTTAADVLLGMILVFATLESAFGICVGCRIFALLMRAGVIPRRGVRGVREHLDARAAARDVLEARARRARTSTAAHTAPAP